MIARFAAALLLTVSVAYAQTQDTITVAVTNVDAIVSDSKGAPVRGLTKDDFEVFEKGQKREITNFSEIAKGSGNEPAPRRILVLLDNSTLTIGPRRAAVEALKTWVAESIRPNDAMLIASAAPIVTIRQQWTSDRTAIAAALDALSKESAGRQEQERRRADSQIQGVLERAADTSRNAAPVTFDETLNIARVYASSSMRDSTELVKSVAAVVNAFSKMQEKKILVLVGQGLQVNPGFELFNYLHNLKMQIESGQSYQRLLPTARRAAPMTEATQYDLSKALGVLTSMATQKGITIYTLNPGSGDNTSGLVEGNEPRDFGADFAKTSSYMSGYQLLSSNTGGRSFFGARPGIALTEITRDLDAHYSIGFRASASAEPGAIEVRSKSGLRVRESVGVAPLTPADTVRDLVMAQHAAPSTKNDLGIKLAADPAVADGDKRKVAVKVLIPIDSLQLKPEGNEVAGGFTVFIATGDERGNSSDVSTQTHPIRWPADALPQIKGRTMTFNVEVVLEPGRTQVSVGVMDQVSEKVGFGLLKV